MKTSASHPSPFRRFVASALAFVMAVGPLASPGYAALTSLADEPLNIKTSAKPNIVLTVDDSTSMLFDYLPDYIIGAYCRDGTGRMSALCGDPGDARDLTLAGAGRYRSPGYIFQQFNAPYVNFDAGFDPSGPGAGCDLTIAPFGRCSGGINPGPLPGIATYPAASIKSGQPFEYWKFWPAPVHNSALNRLYYNPRLEYEPPAYADGTSYPQMNAGNTTAWTRVPADPWATTIEYVNLTTTVTVGQWCNSDWTQGNDAASAPFVNNAGHCRVNGLVAAASAGAPAADGDYTYPWAWPGGAAPKSQKYFYQNDNSLWCDATHASWPQTGPPVAQTCNGVVTRTQTCNGERPQTCGGGTAQTCNGVQTQTCGGVSSQTCDNITRTQTCGGSVTQTCNGATAQTCGGGGTQTCGGMSAQTCGGVRAQTCGGIGAQSCNGVRTQACNINTTCDAPVCRNAYDPPGCETCTGAECPVCRLISTCDPPVCRTTGSCSVVGNACTSNAQCPTQAGNCSATGGSCMNAGQCPNSGSCTVTRATCTNDAQCPTQAGACSTSGAGCFANGDCPNSGRCTRTNAVCTSNAQCPTVAGACNLSGAGCSVNADCPPFGGSCSASRAACTTDAQCPTLSGACTINAAACTSNAQCGGVFGRCSRTSANCQSTADCPNVAGNCSQTRAACFADSACPVVPGTCSSSGATCIADSQCPNVGKRCSITNSACTSDAQCSTQPGTCSIATTQSCTDNSQCGNVVTPGTCSIETTRSCTTNDTSATGCPNVRTPGTSAVCSSLMTSSTSSLLQDANGAGVVCRRNNKDYAGVTASQFNFPSGRFTTQVTGGSGVNACVPTARYRNVARHYWKTDVEWCTRAVATVADKWVGYGDAATGGSCQPFRDSTHIYPRFHQFGSASTTSNYTTPAFARIDLDIANRGTATYTHNWVDDLGIPQTVTRNFDQEMINYANWFAYYRTRIQATKTVTSLSFKELDTQYRVGFHTLSNNPVTSFVNVQDFNAAQKTAWFRELFAIDITLGKETPNLDAIERIGEYYKNGGNPSLSGSSNPIQLSCQKNWHMLFTDGITNQRVLPPTAVGNLDADVPPLPVPVTGLTSGSPWPSLFRENSTVTDNSASDYVTYYWVTDFRTSGAQAPNNVPGSLRDPATWQHQNFAALSLGTEGQLPAGNQSVVESQLSVGTLAWPQTLPNVTRPNSSGVDDLWHAAVNGRGKFVNAQTADELKLGMGSVLQDVLNQAGARAGNAFPTSTLSGANNHVYRVSFQPGWYGNVAKIRIDPTTGADVAEVWNADTQLTAQLVVVPTVRDTPWFTERKIVTMNDSGTAVPFLWASLSAAQKDSLAPGRPARGQRVLEFLRGDRRFEGSRVGQFRVRGGPLGDIVNSQAIFVGKPNAPYSDGNDPGYAAFKSTFSARSARIYVGANDGMLHAFNDVTGDETFAFVPKALYRNDVTGLRGLALQDGALPPFRHRYYVDATPRVIDVDFGGGSWKSLLVHGLGKGGRAYYAIDVTDPGSITSETAAASNVKWEFTDTDMGFSYGRAILVKTRAFGGKWVAMIPVGYNNPSGVGKIFIVDAATGALLKTMSTGTGSSANPAGLAHISGYIRDFRNQLVEQIYGGDLLGNFWRFDVSAADPNTWTVDLMARLTDAGGAAQPVTTPPQIEVDATNGVDRWVFVGTGRLLHDDDLTNTQTQTMYAFRDGTTLNPLPITGALTRSDLVDVTRDDPLGIAGLATRPDKGWFDDLPAGGDIVTPPQAAISVVAYAAAFPQTDPCLTGQPSRLFAREFSRGNSLLQDTAGGPLVESVFSAEGGVGLELIQLDVPVASSGLGDSIRAVLSLGTGRPPLFVRIQLPPNLLGHRMSWRLLGE